jgi:hypothetical protein
MTKALSLSYYIMAVFIDKGRELKVQIRKTYQNVNPELLYDEVKDLITKQGVVIGEAKMETYSLPDDTSSFISRGVLTFRMQDEPGNLAKECLRVNIMGSARGETRMIFDIDKECLPQKSLDALQSDLDFILGSYEVAGD